MGPCPCSCKLSNELYSTIRNDQSKINIENLDENEDKFLNTDKHKTAKAQCFINHTMQKIPRSSLNPVSKSITNNIIMNNIVVSPHSKSEISENEKMEPLDSRNSLISINIKKRPIFAKLHTRKSSKN
jgi:hypothetical protein